MVRGAGRAALASVLLFVGGVLDIHGLTIYMQPGEATGSR